MRPAVGSAAGTGVGVFHADCCAGKLDVSIIHRLKFLLECAAQQSRQLGVAHHFYREAARQEAEEQARAHGT